MKTLIVIPTQEEIDAFLHSCAEQGLQAEGSWVGKLPVVGFPYLGVTVACGGLGKAQFAVQTQHLLSACVDWELVICAGAAGALVDDLAVGDVVVSTETVEHDIRSKFGKPILPRFSGAETAIAELRCASLAYNSFQVTFGPIASGDEDIVDTERRRMLQELTGALAVAWEGAGGARACHFSDVPFIEVRGVTDQADSSAASDFEANLKRVMGNVAILTMSWMRELHIKA